ncbi:MAG: hypothetical protein ACRDUB_22510, partial [Mycobacterium sp.]
DTVGSFFERFDFHDATLGGGSQHRQRPWQRAGKLAGHRRMATRWTLCNGHRDTGTKSWTTYVVTIIVTTQNPRYQR